jgi:hypothetical protein
MATWPVHIIGDDPGRLTFTVAVDEQQVRVTEEANSPETEIRRRRGSRSCQTDWRCATCIMQRSTATFSA